MVYASPQRSACRVLWDSISSLATPISDPWVVFGDFNSFAFGFEKQGGAAASVSRYREFWDWIDRCNFLNIGYVGPHFSWKRGAVEEQLDRVLCKLDWRMSFIDTEVHHLPLTRQYRNRIEALKDSSGNWCHSVTALQVLAVDFFSDLYTNPFISRPAFEIRGFFSHIPSYLWDNIVCTPDLMDIRQAVFSMGSYKSLGPDGVPSIFYQKFWAKSTWIPSSTYLELERIIRNFIWSSSQVRSKVSLMGWDKMLVYGLITKKG
ncbi:hypothetical protein GH714_014552 [Hevea brasiliensis]|uniref:Endonuclease/exonuclease/phosphatase domain-containing protein n=1 Tax=Hevea brasiliensis TaxID=3981 RepID=A0A6A6LKJ3_HEVBR|nr:hypothetical protein GH714_014552 [Hevea brasiliensis]